MTRSAQSLCCVGPDHNLVLADSPCTLHNVLEHITCSNCFFKDRFVHPLLCALACVIHGCHNHALNHHSRGSCSSFPSQTLHSLHPVSFDLWRSLQFGKVVKQLQHRGSKSAHVWVWTMKIFHLAQEERKCVLKARNISPCSQNIWWADRDTFTPSGTYATQQLPVAAALHSGKKHCFSKPEPWMKKNPSEGEEYAKLLLGYIKLRIDPTVLKFLPDFT